MPPKQADRGVYGVGRRRTSSWKTDTNKDKHTQACKDRELCTYRERKAISAQKGLTGAITQTLGKWKTRKLEEALKKLQQAADNNDMRPLWKFESNLRMNKTANRVAIKKKGGSECHGLNETLKRSEEWAQECFVEGQARLKPQVGHSGNRMGKEMATISPNIQEIRQRASLAQVIKEEPETGTWMNQAYTELDIDREIRNLANRKAHGGDGIPGELCEETWRWAIKQ